MRYIFLLIFYSILFALPTNITPLLERSACGVTLTAARGEYAFDRVGATDLCLAVKLVEQITSSSAQGVTIYLVPFTIANWSDIPALATLYTQRDIRETDFQQLSTGGFSPAENVIQIDPDIFGETKASDGRNKKQTEGRRHLEQWNGMITIAHELLHTAMGRSGISMDDQHCVMVYPPYGTYLVGLYRSIGVQYGVPQGISDIQSGSEADDYREQCAAWLAKYTTR